MSHDILLGIGITAAIIGLVSSGLFTYFYIKWSRECDTLTQESQS